MTIDEAKQKIGTYVAFNSEPCKILEVIETGRQSGYCILLSTVDNGRFAGRYRRGLASELKDLELNSAHILLDSSSRFPIRIKHKTSNKVYQTFNSYEETIMERGIYANSICIVFDVVSKEIFKDKLCNFDIYNPD